MPIKLNTASGGGVILTGANTASDKTITVPASDGTMVLVGTTLTQDTAKASTSGTSVDFTGIPSYAKRITVMFNAVSTNGTSNYVVRIGNSTFTATGYVSAMTYTNLSSNSSVGLADTTGYLLTRDTGTSTSFTGILRICLLSNFVYVASFNAIGGSGGPTYQGAGVLNLGSVLDRVRVTTLNGTDTFDAGTINIMYEG